MNRERMLSLTGGDGGELSSRFAHDFGGLVQPPATEAAAEPLTRLDVFHQYVAVFMIAFLVTVIATPLMRRLAVRFGIIDRPSDPRKVDRVPVAYLGGVAVFLGILVAIACSYIAVVFPGAWLSFHVEDPFPVPLSIVGGLTIITFIGLWDDVATIDPRLKIGGQLLAAAMLAMNEIGTRVAAGIMGPIGTLIGNSQLVWYIDVPQWMPLLHGQLQLDLIYWAGVAIIAIFVLGACNASNLIDGLDGLCTGVTGVAQIGLLVIALGMAVENNGPLDSARLVLILATLGACMGFLPHNFNPAVIFLGDCGSMLLGYATIVVILMLGDTGQTPLVVAGLLIYALPIIDTTLAIIRRKLAGKSISDADDQHLHHQLKRAMGVKGAVLSLYGIAGLFAVLGVGISLGRARDVYVVATVLAAFIIVTAVKIAQRQAIERAALTPIMPKGRGAVEADDAGSGRLPTSTGKPEPAPV